MIDLIERILGGAYEVRERGEEILLYRRVLPRQEPEDCIAVRPAQGGYTVCEVHRGSRTVRARAAREQEAAAYGAVLCERMFRKGADQRRARWIRICVDQGRESEVVDSINRGPEGSLSCIGREDPGKISLLKTPSAADVKFAGEYLAKGIPLTRAYVVLDNFCGRLEEARGLWRRLESLGIRADRSKVFRLYLFGDETKGRDGL